MVGWIGMAVQAGDMLAGTKVCSCIVGMCICVDACVCIDVGVRGWGGRGGGGEGEMNEKLPHFR